MKVDWWTDAVIVAAGIGWVVGVWIACKLDERQSERYRERRWRP